MCVWPYYGLFYLILILLMPVYFRIRDRKEEFEFEWVGKCKDMGKFGGRIVYVLLYLIRIYCIKENLFSREKHAYTKVKQITFKAQYYKYFSSLT